MAAGWFATGAVFCGLGVILGAFGAHGLRERLTPEMLVVFETGVRYHLIHGLGLLIISREKLVASISVDFESLIHSTPFNSATNSNR